MKKISVLVLAAAWLSFFSCVSGKTGTESISPVYVTNTKKVHILSPENCGKSIDDLVLFSGIFNGNEMQFPVLVESNKSGISMVMMNQVGLEMGNLFFDGKSLSFVSSVIPKKVKMEYILADFQFASYPFDVVQRQLEEAGLSFTEEILQSNDKNGETKILRKIVDGKKVIEEILVDSKCTVIRNNLRGYEFTMETNNE